MANHQVKAHLKRMEALLHAATEVNDAAIAAWDAEDDEALFSEQEGRAARDRDAQERHAALWPVPDDGGAA